MSVSSTSTTTASTGSDILRITGLASGLDVDAMVKKLMTAENVKVDEQKQKLQTIQWTQDTYRDTIGDLNTFSSTYFDVTKKDSYMLSDSSYSNYSTTNSASSVAAATMGANAAVGDYKVEVAALATSSSEVSGAFTVPVGLTNSSKMSSIAGLDGKVTFSINGSAPITYDFAGADKDRTIGDILSDISTKAKVTMSYSELANKFVITSNNTGAVSSLTGSDDLVNTSASNGFLNTIFGSNSLGASVGTTTYTAGVDGQVTITEPNGVSGTVINASNNLSYDGVTYNLKSTGTTTISTTVDVQKTYDKIKALVTKYNDSISKITAKLNEKKLSAYPPLTDTQRAGMTADQISQWEVKAKQGLLANDNNLQNMLSSLRSAFYTSVQGAGIALADVGLSTSSDIFNHSGEIQIDDTKLKAAIQSNPDGVKKLFAQQSTSVPFYSSSLTPDQEKTKISEEGIFQRLNDILKQNLSTSPDSFGNRGMLVQKAGVSSSYSGFTDMLTQQITDENKVIADLNTKLAAKQQAYYTQFSKLETAMQTMNSQQSQLSSMLSGK